MASALIIRGDFIPEATMRRGVVIRTVAALGALASLAPGAQGQRVRGPGGFVGVSFVAADAVGDLGALVDQGFGMQLEGGVPVALNGHVRVRGDLGFLVYGHERQRFCYGLSCRLVTDLTTTNSILYGGFGPELVLGTGAVEPYVHATAGLAGFVTSSSLDDRDGYGPYLETTNYSDVVFAWKAGGGLRMRVGNGFRPVFLDFGVDWHDNGVADFLTAGDIVDHPDGSISVFPNRSEADLVTFRVGVAVGFPSRSGYRDRRGPR
jgi:hypothetical protein